MKIELELNADQAHLPEAALMQRLVDAIDAEQAPGHVVLNVLMSAYAAIVLASPRHHAAALVACNRLSGEILAALTEETPAAGASAAAATAPSTPTAH